MTVVYPLSPQIDHTELKYSLRSIEKYLPPPFEVVIVGDRVPEWVNNVTQIDLPDVPGRKQLSIKRKILAALEYAEEIVFMNDDVYLLKPQSFPYYYLGTLKDIGESGARPLQNQLLTMNKPIKCFDGHYPLIYDRRFKEVVKNFPEDCVIKSMYCNYLEIEGVEFPDCKILNPVKADAFKKFIKDKPCFSTGTNSLISIIPFLEELFSKQSNFEI